MDNAKWWLHNDHSPLYRVVDEEQNNEEDLQGGVDCIDYDEGLLALTVGIALVCWLEPVVAERARKWREVNAAVDDAAFEHSARRVGIAWRWHPLHTLEPTFVSSSST